MPVTGQCKVDPVSGVAGDIWNALTGDGDNGLAAITLTSGSTARKLVGALYQAIASAIVNNASSAHTDGAAVSWAQGTGAGQIEIGAGLPNGVFVSATGCDEGGTVTITGGASATAGVFFKVHFATAFTNAPSPSVTPGNANAGEIYYGDKWHVTATTTVLTFTIDSAASYAIQNINYTFNWGAKGSA